MWNLNSNVRLLCIKYRATGVCMGGRFSAAVRCKDLLIYCVTRACRSHRDMSPRSYFSGSAALHRMLPPAAHCYLSSRRKQLLVFQTLASVFARESMDWHHVYKLMHIQGMHPYDGNLVNLLLTFTYEMVFNRTILNIQCMSKDEPLGTMWPLISVCMAHRVVQHCPPPTSCPKLSLKWKWKSYYISPFLTRR